jgi:CRISPR/Cas system-associated exonuclease Cas4 (RecB family)
MSKSDLPKYRVTDLEKYRRCPYCFNLGYNLGIEQQDSENLLIGKTLHDNIERYHKGKPPKDDTMLIRKWLKQYKEIYTDPHHDICEKRMEIELVDPFTGESLGARMSLRIDVQIDGRICEHKTSKRRYTQEDVDTHFQATAYDYVYYLKHGEHANGVRFNIFVKAREPYMETMDTYVDDEKMKAWLEQVKLMLYNIKLGNYEPSNSWWHYYSICPGNQRRSHV